MLATVATEYNSRRTVQYPLQLVRRLFRAACQKAVAVVKPRDYKAVDYRRCSGPGECASAALDAT